MLTRAWSMLGNLRLVFAVLAVVGGWQWWQHRSSLWGLAALIGALTFVWLAARQRRIGGIRDAAAAIVTVNQRAIERLQLNWDALPLPPDVRVDASHPYARDLNIIGKASIVQRIGTPGTQHGWQALYESLLTDRDTGDVPARQGAINELAGHLPLRQAVESAGARHHDVPDPQRLLDWAESEPWLKYHPLLRLVSVIGPALFIASALLWTIGTLPASAMIPPLLLNGLVFFAFGAPAAQRIQHVATLREAIESYGIVMDMLKMAPARSPILSRISGSLQRSTLSMLNRLSSFAIPAGSMLYFPLQLTLMWDVNLLHQLEKWQVAFGQQLDDWLHAVGEWESLAALAVLKHDHPDWVFPTIDRTTESLTATGLAHPLLHQEIAIGNDATVGPVGHFLFVTGSNMSGKSTLLRAIGANAVLAQAGSVVAATSLVMPPLRIATCMRVEDSLEHGVSFFMAELQRLKAVVDRTGTADETITLYLLDEILQGTNTAERQIASRQVLRQLAQQNAIGAVSSHDLELIDESLVDAAVLVHFSEQFTNDPEPMMTFDYLLRPGLATSSNAMRLMEMLGFEIEG